ncbi:MAG TPA: amidohydrolase family protein [Xanthobacteraceae bacterium]|nr:amidohydrolase family protein [Xanthobacteraceae bacterium]
MHSHPRAIDIHAHYFGQSYLDLLNEQSARYGTEYRSTGEGWYFKSPIGGLGPLPTRMIDIRQRVAEMDAQGVAVHALSLTAPMVYWAEPEFSHRLARAWNDDAIAAHAAYPDRFVVLATLPMLDPDRAIDELNRVSSSPAVRGVYMGTNIDGRDLDDPLFGPILARIDALGLPIFLHPQQTIGGERLAKFYLSNFLGNPFDSAIAACHLIFGGVLDRHPNLQFNLPHAGGALPGLIGRIDHGWKVRPETKHLAQAPSTYLRRFTYDTITHSAPILQFLISQVGADRVMIGSDYCFDMGYERPVQVLDELGLKDEERKLILGGTAAAILKM